MNLESRVKLSGTSKRLKLVAILVLLISSTLLQPNIAHATASISIPATAGNVGSLLIPTVASTNAVTVTTSGIADNQNVTVNWVDAYGTPTAQPVGLSITGTPTSSNSSTLTIQSTSAFVALGYRYFTLTIAGATSPLARLDTSQIPDLVTGLTASDGARGLNSTFSNSTYSYTLAQITATDLSTGAASETVTVTASYLSTDEVLTINGVVATSGVPMQVRVPAGISTITVTGTLGASSKSYVINVNRAAYNEGRLTALAISAGSFSFLPNVGSVDVGIKWMLTMPEICMGCEMLSITKVAYGSWLDV